MSVSLWGFYCHANVHDQKQLGETRTWLGSRFRFTVHYQRKSGQALRVGTWRQALKQRLWKKNAVGSHLLNCLSCFLLHSPRTICPGWHRLQRAGSSPINHQSGKWPTDVPTGNRMETVSSLRFFSQRTLVCITLTERTDQHKLDENKTHIRKVNSNPVSISSIWGGCCQL